MEAAIGKGVGDAVAYGAKQYMDLQMKYVKGFLD